MELFDVDTLVIGAGVVGIAVARELAKQGREVWLIEKESEVGSQTSSRNSEVIHAGIYYPKDSLKAELCVRGKELLYQYCDQNQVAYNRCGKLIVATNPDQLTQLDSIRKHAERNGVRDIVALDRHSLLDKESSLNALAGLYSPSTGVIDSHALMTQMLADFERFGGQLVLNTELVAHSIRDGKFCFELKGQDAAIAAKRCVNSAGLQAIGLFQNVEGYSSDKLPIASFAKGDYFSYGARVPFKHLIYPVPEQGGLGIHLTLDLNGMAKFGPDVTWLANGEPPFDYSVDPGKREKFARAIQSYWPGLDPEKLAPDYSGVRPKVSGPTEPAADFLIQGASIHGINGLVNLFGIESPGLTSCFAIAEKVADIIE